MVLDRPGFPLELRDLTDPSPGVGELLVRVRACAVCRTDLHIVDGELPAVRLPLIPGHQIVGTVEKIGAEVQGFAIADRVGIPWLGWTCGDCAYCKSDRENLCDRAKFTGYTCDGGYAEAVVADARFCFRLPANYDDAAVAPLLCAGLIGYRALRKTDSAERLGIYGFGNAARIITQVARAQGREVCAFTRPGDVAAQRAAIDIGAVWAGGSDQAPPRRLDAAIVFAPVGSLVPIALRNLVKGGRVVCGGIHMSDIPSFSYRDLWEERSIESVANLTRRDATEFLEIAARLPLRIETETFSLADGNEAVARFRDGTLRGTAVLVP